MVVVEIAHPQSYHLQLSSKNKKAIKWYHEAETAFKARDNQKALLFLDKAVNKDKKFIEAWLLKGDILTELKQNSRAVIAYQKAVAIDPSFFPPVWYFMGNIYYDMGEYAQSVKALKTFLKFNNLLPAQIKLGTKQLTVSQKALALKKHPIRVDIIRLDSLINTSDEEYINYVDAGNRQLIFTRKVKTESSWIEKFYYSDKSENGWKRPQPWNISWFSGLDVGGMSLTVDGQQLYFTGCGWPGSYGGCDLYRTVKRGSRWQKPVNLGRSVNSTAWDSQPYVSSDGKMLLFSSSRKGGKGGSDIWMSVKLKNGRWSPPVNLGDSINTPGNEMAPFLYADNKTLIFSSTGWPGMGKQDLFISRKDKTGSWSKAENIGYPVNTKYAEINLVYSLDGDNVWISSDRDKHGFDIYRIPVYEKIKPGKIIYFAGRVLDKFSKKPVKAKIMLTDELTGTNVTTKYSSREDGYFLMVMEPGKTYAFNILAKGYLFYSGKFTPAIDSSVNRKLNKDFLLTPVQKGTSVVLKNLYFDTDHWNLTAKSYPELKKLIAFLTINPKVKIEIAGHTDDTGNDDYNMKLSKLRAKSVYDYLISKGISPNRLTYNGYGNTRPVFDNSTTEGKALNRRVEVVIKE